MRASMRFSAVAAVLLTVAGGPEVLAKSKPKPNTLLLGDLGDGAKLWLMLDSVRLDEGSIRHAWTVIDYPGPRVDHDISYQSDASKFYVDCKAQQIMLANAIKFSGAMGAGKNVFQVNSEPTPEPAAQDYHAVRPNTAEAVVANAVCKPKLR